MDFGRFLTSHLTSAENKFLSKHFSTTSENSIFKSKEFSSDLYSGKEWDFDSLLKSADAPAPALDHPSLFKSQDFDALMSSDAPAPTSLYKSRDFESPDAPAPTSVAKTLDASLLKSQEYIPKLLESSDWDANLSIEDVKATAEELAKQNGTAMPVMASTPKQDPFADAFKSSDWSIMPGDISDDIDYSPEILEDALMAANSEPLKKTPDVFVSRDWVMSELLSSSNSLSPDVFRLDEAPVETDAKTDWGDMFMSQLAPPAPAAKPPKKKRVRKKRKKIVPDHKEYVTISDHDVLLGRGGKSNHHPGNQRYRAEVQNFRGVYGKLVDDKEKTEMSQVLVDVIEKMGGRFLEEEGQGRRQDG